MNQALTKDVGAWLMCGGHAKPQTGADDTYVDGAILDRNAAAGDYQSGLAICSIAFTTAGGAGGATNVLTLDLQHGDDSGLSDEATFDTDSYTYTWAANGANSGLHVMPVNLETAKRYIQVRAKLAESGTITTSAWLLSVLFVGIPGQVRPNSAYAAAGYEITVEPS